MQPTSSRTAAQTLEQLEGTQPQTSVAGLCRTGFHPLDEVLGGGVQAGDLLLIGGKPGQGKTIAALQWARHMAATGNIAIFACYEHDELTLLTRLLAAELGEVAADAGWVDEIRLGQMRAGLRAIGVGAIGVREVLDSDPLLGQAEERLRTYADRLVLVRASGTRTDLQALDELVELHRGDGTALFVDYIQKVPVVPEPEREGERVKRVAEGLKELALTKHVAVVAVAAADAAGLDARRLRLRHMRGSTALAYEADAAVILNDKLAVVAKAHVAYDTTRAAVFRRQVVFSVEKNRNGPADVELEFEKDFENYRFDGGGRWVGERLWDEASIEA